VVDGEAEATTGGCSVYTWHGSEAMEKAFFHSYLVSDGDEFRRDVAGSCTGDFFCPLYVIPLH
jgi:hypothetical protein